MFGIINECYHMLKGSLLIFIDYEVTKGKMDSVFLSVTGKALNGGENK